jgi:hypothetical protein
MPRFPRIRGITAHLAAAATLAVAAPAVAAPFSFDVGNGVPGNVPQFTWQGLTFELQNQPAGRTSADHRVSGDSEGNLNITLEEGQSGATGSSAKVTYGARVTGKSHFKLGFEQLDAETDNFANLQGFFRNNTGTNNTVVQLLVGTDSTNPGSPFAGVQTRAEGESSFQVSDFVDNTPLGASGTFELDTEPDGTTSGTVRIDGSTASVTRDLSTLNNFEINDFLLQVETFQPDSEFQTDFPDGQTFTFTSATVPGPASIGLVAAGLVILGGLGCGGSGRRTADSD